MLGADRSKAREPVQTPRDTRLLALLNGGCALAGLAAIVLICIFEGGAWQARIFALAVYGALLAALCFLTGRLLFSAIVAASIPLLVFFVSRVKLNFLDLPFLYFDVVYLLRSNFVDLMRNDLRIGIAIVLAVTVLLAVFLVSWKWDRRSSKSGRVAALATFATLAIALVSYPELQRLDEMDLTSWNHKVATFFVSVTRAESRLEPRPARIERTFPATYGSAALPLRSGPDIIAILEESTFDFRELITTSIRQEALFTNFFEPKGGKHGRLRVHTFGGQTWLAEFAFLTGIPHSAFGTNGNFAPFTLAGRIRTSLPEYLRRLGYKTVALYPSGGSFVNARRFYGSIGVERFLDPSNLVPPRSWNWRTPDDEILDTAIQVLKSARREDSRPIFLMTLTINQHGPHNGTPAGEQVADSFLPERVPAEEAPAFGEYLTRFRKSALAVERFIAEFKASFPNRPAIVVHFGDHHPSLSKRAQFTSGDEGRLNRALMLTYFSIIPINFDMERSDLDSLPELDIALLPAHLIASAGLPLDEIWSIRTTMGTACFGQYADCESATKTRLHGTLLGRNLVLD